MSSGQSGDRHATALRHPHYDHTWGTSWVGLRVDVGPKAFAGDPGERRELGNLPQRDSPPLADRCCRDVERAGQGGLTAQLLNDLFKDVVLHGLEFKPGLRRNQAKLLMPIKAASLQ